MKKFKEKAEELVDKFYVEDDLLRKDLSYIQAKQCALIAVDEILMCCIGTHEKYWQEVKQEIELL